MAERHFRKNSTTFNCRSCGRLTRDTTGTNQQLCPQCDAWTMIENGILDGDLTGQELADSQARIAQLKAEAVKKGGRFEESTTDAAAQVEIKPDGDANFYTLVSAGRWIARVQLNGEFLTARQEEMMRLFAEALRPAL